MRYDVLETLQLALQEPAICSAAVQKVHGVPAALARSWHGVYFFLSEEFLEGWVPQGPPRNSASQRALSSGQDAPLGRQNCRQYNEPIDPRARGPGIAEPSRSERRGAVRGDSSPRRRGRRQPPLPPVRWPARCDAEFLGGP